MDIFDQEWRNDAATLRKRYPELQAAMENVVKVYGPAHADYVMPGDITNKEQRLEVMQELAEMRQRLNVRVATALRACGFLVRL